MVDVCADTACFLLVVVVAGGHGNGYVCVQSTSEIVPRAPLMQRSFASTRLHLGWLKGAEVLGWLEGAVQWDPLLVECVGGQDREETYGTRRRHQEGAEDSS